jgi:hypothetical protein
MYGLPAGVVITGSAEGRNTNGRIVRLADINSTGVQGSITSTITVRLADNDSYHLPDVARGAALSILTGDRNHIARKCGTWDNVAVLGVQRYQLGNRKYIAHNGDNPKRAICVGSALDAQRVLSPCLPDSVHYDIADILDRITTYNYDTGTIVANCDYNTAEQAWCDVVKIINQSYDDSYHRPYNQLLTIADMIILIGAIQHRLSHSN